MQHFVLRIRSSSDSSTISSSCLHNVRNCIHHLIRTLQFHQLSQWASSKKSIRDLTQGSITLIIMKVQNFSPNHPRFVIWTLIKRSRKFLSSLNETLQHPHLVQSLDSSHWLLSAAFAASLPSSASPMSNLASIQPTLLSKVIVHRPITHRKTTKVMCFKVQKHSQMAIHLKIVLKAMDLLQILLLKRLWNRTNP